MGGFANLNDVDINFSKRFMAELSKSLPKLNYNEVLDCGAGIGRISKELLSNLFRTVIRQLIRSTWLTSARTTSTRQRRSSRKKMSESTIAKVCSISSLSIDMTASGCSGSSPTSTTKTALPS